MTGWMRFLAGAFAVVTLGVGVGFVSGAIAYQSIGPEGEIIYSPFGHIAEVIGWGAGFLTMSLATSATLLLSRPGRAGKPRPPGSVGLE